MRFSPSWGVCLTFVFLLGCAHQPGIRIDSRSCPLLGHAETPKRVVWHKYSGLDFDVFYGEFKGDRTSGFGFYLGGHPNAAPAPQSESVPGRLGAFSVDWRQRTQAHPPQVHRDAVFAYQTTVTRFSNREQRYTESIHVWVYGENAQQIAEATAYLDGLAVFQSKPADEIREIK